jgi:uncharacterized protein YjbJ (UPF0337 family)
VRVSLRDERRETVNWEQIRGQWRQVKGAVKAKWGKLTDDDLDVIAGQQEQLIGKIQERYGIKKEEAHRQVDDWLARLGKEDEARGRTPERKAG